jgi:hypothetical protein
VAWHLVARRQTNDEDFDLVVEITNKTTGELQSLTDWVFEFVMKDANGKEIVSHSSEDGDIIVTLADSTVAFHVGVDTMKNYCGNLPIGCRYTTDDGSTKQLFTGYIPVIEGMFSA